MEVLVEDRDIIFSRYGQAERGTLPTPYKQ